MTSAGFSLKDQLFNETKVDWLARQFHAADPRFEAGAFTRAVMRDLPALELKQRIALIGRQLAGYLPDDFAAAAARVHAALPPPLDPGRRDDDFGDFILAPLGEYVATHGLEERHFDIAMALLEALTQRFSMEFALRPFFNRWPEATLAQCARWLDHPHYHVRRLVSEGSRPRLPWGMAIDVDPRRTLPLLDRLHADPTRFVTRSVANHLNDIAKIDPDLVLGRLALWQAEGRQEEGELDWMRRHALRNLIKAGHSGAMAHLGFDRDLPVAARIGLDAATFEIGKILDFTVELSAERGGRAVVDYRIRHPRPNGRSTEKVFKLKQVDLRRGASLRLAKRHPLKADATTFTLRPGPARLVIQINGIARAKADFVLV